MTSSKKPKSLQDILKQRSQSTFVGREAQIELFRSEMGRSPELRDYFIFNVYGQGGVGKSTLMRQFRKLAEETKFVTALTSDAESSVPETMGRLAEQLEQQGHPLERFAERYKVYRQKKQELESDPDAPQGFSTFMGKAIAKASLGAVKQIPGSGAVTPFLDEDAISGQAGEWASYVAKKLGNKDEVRLVKEPVAVLTPLFLQDLGKLAEQHHLLLLFDVYERTSSFLDSWLRELLEGRHGDLPANLLLAIAGRDELDKNRWADWEGAIARLPLNPFTEAEAIQFLTRKGTTNEKVIDVILRLSGCLPLLVTTLASAIPDDPTQIGDPSGTAVERFLQWVDDPKRRQFALDAALPLTFNQDIVAVLHGEENADELFNWLRTMPFVEERSNGWAYHAIARTQMLRYKRRTSPKNWADLHGKLADYYDQQRDELTIAENLQWQDASWQTYTLNVAYHRLCQMPQRYLAALPVNDALAVTKNEKNARRLAEIAVQAGQDAEGTELEQWGKRFVSSSKAYDEDRYDEIVATLTDFLVKHPGLVLSWKSLVLGARGFIHRLMKRDQDSIRDLNEAVALDPKNARLLANRGFSYHLMGRYEQAITDFSSAIELDPNSAWVFNRRGLTYTAMERYKEAAQDFERAIEVDAQYKWAFANRGRVDHLKKQYENALINFDRAIELDPEHAWAITHRGITYRSMKQYDKALQDFNRAIEVDPKFDWAIACRGVTYHLMEHYKDALCDFNQAIDLDPEDVWSLTTRGETYRLMERYEEALQDFNRAIEIDPKLDLAIASRGTTYRLIGRYEEALCDFDRAIKLDPEYWCAIASRGEILMFLGRYDEALANFNWVIGQELNDWRLYNRALAYRALNQLDNGKADLDHAIQLAQQKYDKNPEHWNNVFNLALYHLAAGTTKQAWHFYSDALKRSASPSSVQAAIHDIECFLQVFPGHEWAEKTKAELEKRGLLHH